MACCCRIPYPAPHPAPIVASLGASGSEIGLIAGIFGYSAIFIRLFSDTGVRAFGKKTCLYAGLLFSLLATAGYALLIPSGAIVAARVIHGFGFWAQHDLRRSAGR